MLVEEYSQVHQDGCDALARAAVWEPIMEEVVMRLVLLPMLILQHLQVSWAWVVSGRRYT